MANLNAKGVEERAKILAEMTAKAAAATVERWMSDPGKLAIINALAASFAK